MVMTSCNVCQSLIKYPNTAKIRIPTLQEQLTATEGYVLTVDGKNSVTITYVDKAIGCKILRYIKWLYTCI